MANTTSIAFPNMFDVSSNKVNVLSDVVSVVNRSRLLMLTEPTELYNNIDFGVGMRQYLWQYNTSNVRAMMKNRIIDQLRIHEPYVHADKTAMVDGLISDDNNEGLQQYNKLKVTVGLSTIFGDNVEVTINDEQ